MGREGWGGSEWGPGEHWCLGAVPNPLANAGDICHQLQEGKSKKRSCAKCTEFLDSGRLCWFCYHFPCNPTNLGSNLTLKHFPGSYQEKDLKVSCFIPSSYFYPKFCLFVCCCFLCVILFFFQFLIVKFQDVSVPGGWGTTGTCPADVSSRRSGWCGEKGRGGLEEVTKHPPGASAKLCFGFRRKSQTTKDNWD